jgi:hypothetical protein
MLAELTSQSIIALQPRDASEFDVIRPNLHKVM